MKRINSQFYIPQQILTDTNFLLFQIRYFRYSFYFHFIVQKCIISSDILSNNFRKERNCIFFSLTFVPNNSYHSMSLSEVRNYGKHLNISSLSKQHIHYHSHFIDENLKRGSCHGHISFLTAQSESELSPGSPHCPRLSWYHHYSTIPLFACGVLTQQ